MWKFIITMSNIRNFKRNLAIFFFFPRKATRSRIPGPRRDHCISEFVLHGTVLIKDFSVCRDTEMRLFKWKVMNRIPTGNMQLKKYGKTNTSWYTFCEKEDQTLIHLFYEFTHVKELQSKFVTWLHPNTTYQNQLQEMLCLAYRIFWTIEVVNLLMILFKRNCRSLNMSLGFFFTWKEPYNLHLGLY